MYIAFKWLLSLATTMWLAMCCVDVYLKKGPVEFAFKNTTMESKHNYNGNPQIYAQINLEMYKRRHSFQPESIVLLHCIMFLSGALAISVFNKKTEIILFTKTKISKINFRLLVAKIAYKIGIARSWSVKKITGTKVLCKHVVTFLLKMKNIVKILKRTDDKQLRLNLALLKKLKESVEERKSLGQLLIAAVNENKNIRMQYQLESLAKSRLLQHIDDTKKKIKENRMKYVSFQHLYLATHQENAFLKARIKKLLADKEEAQNNLLNLINEVYKSGDSSLKLYCSRLIVDTKDNLLNMDVTVEIEKFLRKSQQSTTSCIGLNEAKSWPRCAKTRVSEIYEGNDNLVTLVSDAPKLKGLPGEYVWTVKDKNGLIERLYEYDYETDMDNGDTIRRIRQYSVYFDKDCLLDYSNSRTGLYETNSKSAMHSGLSEVYPMAKGRFVTGSRAFQNFLQENNHIVPSSRGNSLLYE